MHFLDNRQVIIWKMSSERAQPPKIFQGFYLMNVYSILGPFSD